MVQSSVPAGYLPLSRLQRAQTTAVTAILLHLSFHFEEVHKKFPLFEPARTESTVLVSNSPCCWAADSIFCLGWAPLRVQVKFKPHADWVFCLLSHRYGLHCGTDPQSFSDEWWVQGFYIMLPMKRPLHDLFGTWIFKPLWAYLMLFPPLFPTCFPDDLELSDEGGDSSVLTVRDLSPDTVWGPYPGIVQSQSSTDEQETEVRARPVWLPRLKVLWHCAEFPAWSCLRFKYRIMSMVTIPVYFTVFALLSKVLA